MAAGLEPRKSLCQINSFRKRARVGHDGGRCDHAGTAGFGNGPVHTRCESKIVGIDDQAAHEESLAKDSATTESTEEHGVAIPTIPSGREGSLLLRSLEVKEPDSRADRGPSLTLRGCTKGSRRFCDVWLYFAQEHFDLIQKGGKESFFLQAGDSVFAAVHGSIAGRDNVRNIRMFLMDLAGQFQAVHAFHAKVRYQDAKVILLELAESVRSAVGADGAVALHFQGFTAQCCQHLVIIDEEDGFHNYLSILPRAEGTGPGHCCSWSAG